MNVLMVDAYHPDDPDSSVAGLAKTALESADHSVEYVGLFEQRFDTFMSPAERAAYHTDAPLLAPQTKASATAVTAADALLLCYPTLAYSVPAVLKSWMERVLVPGVAIAFDDKGRVTPNLNNLVRLGAITTTPHSPAEIRRARNLGRRTTMWTLRMNCSRRCRRTFLSLPAGAVDADRIRRSLSRW